MKGFEYHGAPEVFEGDIWEMDELGRVAENKGSPFWFCFFCIDHRDARLRRTVILAIGGQESDSHFYSPLLAR
jgi:hypothetical protein